MKCTWKRYSSKQQASDDRGLIPWGCHTSLSRSHSRYPALLTGRSAQQCCGPPITNLIYRGGHVQNVLLWKLTRVLWTLLPDIRLVHLSGLLSVSSNVMWIPLGWRPFLLFIIVASGPRTVPSFIHWWTLFHHILFIAISCFLWIMLQLTWEYRYFFEG